MGEAIDRRALYGKWIHVSEEDTAGQAVDRPGQWNLPPARGRTGFELKPDDTVVNVGIGPSDRPEESSGQWRLQGGDRPTLEITLDSGASQRLKIISAEKDRLVVEKDA